MAQGKLLIQMHASGIENVVRSGQIVYKVLNDVIESLMSVPSASYNGHSVTHAHNHHPWLNWVLPTIAPTISHLLS